MCFHYDHARLTRTEAGPRLATEYLHIVPDFLSDVYPTSVAF